MADTAFQVLDEIRGLMDEQLKLLRGAHHAQQQGVANAQAKAGEAQVGDFGRSIASHIRSMVPAPLQGAVSSIGNAVRLGGQGIRAFQQLNGAKAAVDAAQEAGSLAGTAAKVAGGGGGAGGVADLLTGGGGEAVAGLLAIPGLGEAVGATAIAFVALKAVVYDLPKAIYNWTQSLLESQRASAQFSSALAAVFLRHEVREMTRERAYGEATAGSTGALAEALDNFADALVPLRVLVTNIMNSIGTDLLNIMTAILDVLNEWFGTVQETKETPFDLFRGGATQLQQQGGARAWSARPAPFA